MGKNRGSSDLVRINFGFQKLPNHETSAWWNVLLWNSKTVSHIWNRTKVRQWKVAFRNTKTLKKMGRRKWKRFPPLTRIVQDAWNKFYFVSLGHFNLIWQGWDYIDMLRQKVLLKLRSIILKRATNSADCRAKYYKVEKFLHSWVSTY